MTALDDDTLRAVAIQLANNFREYVSDPERFTLACDDIYDALIAVRDATNAKFSALVEELTDANMEIAHLKKEAAP